MGSVIPAKRSAKDGECGPACPACLSGRQVGRVESRLSEPLSSFQLLPPPPPLSAPLPSRRIRPCHPLSIILYLLSTIGCITVDSLPAYIRTCSAMKWLVATISSIKGIMQCRSKNPFIFFMTISPFLLFAFCFPACR